MMFFFKCIKSNTKTTTTTTTKIACPGSNFSYQWLLIGYFSSLYLLLMILYDTAVLCKNVSVTFEHLQSLSVSCRQTQRHDTERWSCLFLHHNGTM